MENSYLDKNKSGSWELKFGDGDSHSGEGVIGQSDLLTFLQHCRARMLFNKTTGIKYKNFTKGLDNFLMSLYPELRDTDE